MTYYRRRPSQPLKWLLALIIFALALGFTLDSVEGSTIPEAGIDSTAAIGQHASVPAADACLDNNVFPASEKATLLIIAGGLGTMYGLRKKNM